MARKVPIRPQALVRKTGSRAGGKAAMSVNEAPDKRVGKTLESGGRQSGRSRLPLHILRPFILLYLDGNNAHTPGQLADLDAAMGGWNLKRGSNCRLPLRTSM